MAPSNHLGKRVKLTQIRRPFVVGSTAVPFSDTNPKPPGTPDNHTHSWQVFVKGLEDTDITYWVRRVQFKLHESIPNYIRSTSRVPLGGPAGARLTRCSSSGRRGARKTVRSQRDGLG